MKMPSTPFSLVGISFLALFVTDVYSEKVLDVSKGSTAVLRPDLVEAEVTSITWKHGDNFAADWYGRSVPFYRSFKDRSSLGTKTGELIIHDVKLEDGGVYTPEINHKTLAAVTLRVFSPVPKPSITHDCNPEQTKCILSCMFDRMDEMGNIEIFWILDSRREKGGRELHITKETKEKTFICRLNNSVSSESSNELQNPFWTDDESVTTQQIVLIALGLLIFLALLILILCLKISRERNETKPSKECKPRLLKVDHPNSSYSRERTRTMLNEECEQTLLDVYQLVLDFFNKRNPAKPYEESDLTLLKVYQMISRIDRHVTNPDEDVKKSLLNDSNRPEPDENPDLASSSETRPDPDTKTDEDPENLNKDPSEEVNHETGSGSAENDPPETERAEGSSGSPDGGVSTSESSCEQ